MTLILFSITLSACGGARIPSPKTAQSVSRSYFKKYGAKFPASQFSRHNIETVTINGVQEISYHFALVDTIVTFADGHAARTLLKLEKKFPQGWKVQSWEILQTR